jgi:dGTPase
MRARDSRGRAFPEPEPPYRSAFQRDRDRIVHSTAFRRLAYKTQVFPNDEGDYYRTRLTHTLEVAQIARTLARALGLEEDLAEAVALAHDLGHGPFGHSGEDALAARMAGHGGFEHNRQSLRVVDVLERRYPDRRGLNLTYEVRESLIKHGADDARARPELAEFEPGTSPVLEAQLVDVCDSIAYDAADIDDGIRAGLLAPEDLEPLALWRRAAGEVARKYGDRCLWKRAAAPSTAEKLAVVATTRALIRIEADDLLAETGRRLEGEKIASVETVRAQKGYLVGFSAEIAAEKRALQAFLFERLYRHPRVARLRALAERIVGDLFDTFVADPALLPPEWRAWCEEAGRERAVCDYVSGMTDRYAEREHARLLRP